MIIAFPHPPGAGGPGSFQQRFEIALKSLGWQISYAGDSVRPDVIMVVGGTKKLRWLYTMKGAGVPILYRLDGIAWLHRKKRVSWKQFMLAESRNFLSKIIHAHLADFIVYQSQFVENWWNKEGWKNQSPSCIITNGVNTDDFQPRHNFSAPLRLICLEGTLDYSPYAIDLINLLADQLPPQLPLFVFGGFEKPDSKNQLSPTIDYQGKVMRENLPEVYQNAIYLSLDVNAACPNTVIEALASGVPVVGFATGALEELVPLNAGKIVPYGSDPWLLNFPDYGALIEAIITVQQNWDYYSKGARLCALAHHDLEKIVGSYVDVLNDLLDSTTKHKNQ